MGSISEDVPVTVGVLALQGAFNEHTQLLRRAAQVLSLRQKSTSSSTSLSSSPSWTFLEVRTAIELSRCDALIIPGGESTAISLVAQRSNLLEPLRHFVKVQRKPTWGTCAGLILLAESANRTKKGGQELIGGLDVRVNRNHFGRQMESFQADLDLPFLLPPSTPQPSSLSETPSAVAEPDGKDTALPGREKNNIAITAANKAPFKAIFIRAPIVEKILAPMPGIQSTEAQLEDTVVAPAAAARVMNENQNENEKLKSAAAATAGAAPVEVLARLPAARERRKTPPPPITNTAAAATNSGTGGSDGGSVNAAAAATTANGKMVNGEDENPSSSPPPDVDAEIRTKTEAETKPDPDPEAETGPIIAVRQGNVFGTSFHPELTGDCRIHVWWLRQVVDDMITSSLTEA